MKRRLFGIALLGAAMLLTTESAFGFGKKKQSDCGTPCGTYGAAYGAGAPCGGGYTVSYVDKKVTAYKTEWETKDVKVMVNEWVSAKEEFKYVEHTQTFQSRAHGSSAARSSGRTIALPRCPKSEVYAA